MTDDRGVSFGSDNRSGIEDRVDLADHSESYSHETAVSLEGDMVVRWYDQSGGPKIEGWYVGNGSAFEVNVPD